MNHAFILSACVVYPHVRAIAERAHVADDVTRYLHIMEAPPMSVSLRRNAVSVCLLVASLLPAQARAQNWSFDARAVGLGGVGSTSNVAADMVDEQRPYRAIVLPFGLLQVIPNLPKLDPTKDEFDLVRAIEYSASPIHFIVGRDDTADRLAVHH